LKKKLQVKNETLNNHNLKFSNLEKKQANLIDELKVQQRYRESEASELKIINQELLTRNDYLERAMSFKDDEFVKNINKIELAVKKIDNVDVFNSEKKLEIQLNLNTVSKSITTLNEDCAKINEIVNKKYK